MRIWNIIPIDWLLENYFLTEDKVDALANRMANTRAEKQLINVFKQDSSARNLIPDIDQYGEDQTAAAKAIIAKLAEADPDRGKYIPFIVRMYYTLVDGEGEPIPLKSPQQGGRMQFQIGEDLEQLKRDLETYMRQKDRQAGNNPPDDDDPALRPKEKNIDNFKTLRAFKAVIKRQKDAEKEEEESGDGPAQSDKQRRAAISKNTEFTLIKTYELNNGTEMPVSSKRFEVMIPHTEEAACKLGSNTRWCTATREPGMNQFKGYAESGTIYIMHVQDPNQQPREIDIASIELLDDTGIKNQADQQSGKQRPGVEVTTKTPHGLKKGDRVNFSNTPGFNEQSGPIRIIDEYSFKYNSGKRPDTIESVGKVLTKPAPVKFQLHYEKNQFMNREDDPVNQQEIKFLSGFEEYTRFLNMLIDKHYGKYFSDEQETQASDK